MIIAITVVLPLPVAILLHSRSHAPPSPGIGNALPVFFGPLDPPDQGFDSFELAEIERVLASLLIEPVLQQATGDDGHTRISCLAPLIDPHADRIDESQLLGAPRVVAHIEDLVAGRTPRVLECERAVFLLSPVLYPDEVRGYRITDNQLVLAGEWNEEFLAGEVHELNAGGFDLSLLGFDEDFLDELMAPIGDGGGLPGEDVIPEPPANPVSRPGDLWLLGKHRLLCGDSTKAADVRRLMNGERAILFATDPPYLVDYDGTNHPGKTKERENQKNKDWSATYGVTWDDSSQGPELYEGFIKAAIDHAILPDAAWYCWHASRRQAMVEEVWVKCGAFVHQQIIWTKTKPVLVRMHYLWAHEPCFFGWVRPHKPPKVSDEWVSTVWPLQSLEGDDRPEHPTPKPLDAFGIPMRQHVHPGDLCYEPFSGSGSQIMAGQVNHRRVFAMEISPVYVDVAVQRWQGATGEVAVLDGDGRGFDEVAGERLPAAA